MKPSPVPSILLFAATALLLFSLLGRGWYSVNEETVTMSSGPLWSKFCFDSGSGMECQTQTILSGDGGMNIFRITGILFALTGLAGSIMAGIAAIILLSKPRTALALVTLIMLGVATLITLGTFLYMMSRGGRMDLPGYGFFLYFVGAVLAIVGCIMAMKRGGAPQRPGGYAYPPPGHPQMYGYGAQPQGYPPAGYQPAPGYPPQQPPAYAPPQQAPQAMPVSGAPAGAPEGAASPQAGPAHGCGSPMQWVGQYNRWFCSRCNQYG